MARTTRSVNARRPNAQAPPSAPSRPHAVRVPASVFPTDLERIEFAVRFAKADLDALTLGGWADLRAKIERMRWPSRSASNGRGRAARTKLVVPHAPWADPERELPERVLRKLQREVGQLIMDIVDARDAVQRKAFVLPTTHRLVFHAFPLVFADRVVRQVEGRPRDLFLHLLFSSFEHEPPDRVRRCPECQTIFVRRGKQAYCSDRCNNRVTARKWRAKPAVKKKRRDDARTAYRKQVREKLGDDVLVGRGATRKKKPSTTPSSV
jgi:hypothetical protein